MGLLLEKTKLLRAEAWEALMSSPHFRDFKALDEAVVALGGSSEMPTTRRPAAYEAPVKISALPVTRPLAADAKPIVRMPQATAAIRALQEAGEPLPISQLMEAAINIGAEIGGSNPLANFRSTLSKDPRFRSIMRNNMYFWWFATTPVPRNWNEAPDLPLENGSGASGSSPNQEGGDGHAATLAH